MITNEVVNRAIDYILQHINESISVDKIACHCNFSRYYFSRLFKMETGESICQFIRRAKMEQSAFRFKVDRKKSITDICGNYGYSSSNYSTAFKQHHKLSPIEYRRTISRYPLKNPIHGGFINKLESYDACNQKISIEVLGDYPVIYERHKGNYGELAVHWGAFQEKYKEYITEQTLFLERTYDDPNITDVDDCLYDICMTAPKGCMLENTSLINGGRFAVYHFTGHISQIYVSYQSIFNEWLPQSGFEIDDRYGFDIYRKVDCNSMHMEIDFCIPIK